MTESGFRPPEFDSIASRIGKSVATGTMPSVALAVARHGRVIWEEAFGWADQERQIPASIHTPYSLASVSKPFTATAIMILVERGLVDLDDPVNTYLGAGRITARIGDERDATIRRLTNHTAGLPLHWHYFYEDEPWSPPPIDRTIHHYGNIVSPPGERYLYANLGYGILGRVIERVSGQGYAQFMHGKVFEALGLRHTSIWCGADAQHEAAVQYGAGGTPYPPKLTDHPGSGSVWASVHDLVRFGMMHVKSLGHETEPILSEASIDAMQVPTAHEGGKKHYGIGWSICADGSGFRIVGHEGNSGGVATRLVLIPEEEIVVAILTNCSFSTEYPHTELPADLVDAVSPDAGERLKEMNGQAVPASQSESSPAPLDAHASLSGIWCGTVHTFEGQAPFALIFHADGLVEASLAGHTAAVRDCTLVGSWLSGTAALAIPTLDAQRRPHHVLLDLALRGEVLCGALVAITPGEEEDGAVGHRTGFALGYWCQVSRQGSCS